MGQQFLLIGPADEIEADHLVSPLGRLLASPKRDQQTSDDRAIGLNLDANRIGAEQMPATKNVLEEAEEDLRLPAIMPPKREAYIGP